MKNTFTQLLITLLILLIGITNAKAQSWTRVQLIPKLDVYSLLVVNDTIYAGTFNKLYTSPNNGTTWYSSANINNANGITAIAVYHNSVYAGTYGAGVLSSNNLGTNWSPVNNGLYFGYINKLMVWNDKLYAATDGEGFFKYDETTNTWASFNNHFYSNTAGSVYALVPYQSTVAAAAGANGAFYKYNTSTSQWDELYYNSKGIIAGLQANTLLNDDNGILLAGIAGAKKQAVLRSEDGGGHWITDSTGLGALFGGHAALSSTDVFVKGAAVNYAVVNSFYGTNGSNTGNVFIRAKGAPAGTQWKPLATFNNNNYIYTLAESSNRIYAALDSGLYYRTKQALPVTLVNFTAQKQPEGNLLQWQTAQELNSSHFNIQRSSDGQAFKTIATVKATGNSNTVITYHHLDNSSQAATSATVYYRIATADMDGTLRYSNIATIKNTLQSSLFAVWPNPAGAVINLQSKTTVAAATLTITDVAGRPVYQASHHLPALTGTPVYVAALRPGMYVLTIRAKGINESITVVKK